MSTFNLSLQIISGRSTKQNNAPWQWTSPRWAAWAPLQQSGPHFAEPKIRVHQPVSDTKSPWDHPQTLHRLSSDPSVGSSNPSVWHQPSESSVLKLHQKIINNQVDNLFVLHELLPIIRESLLSHRICSHLCLSGFNLWKDLDQGFWCHKDWGGSSSSSGSSFTATVLCWVMNCPSWSGWG